MRDVDEPHDAENQRQVLTMLFAPKGVYGYFAGRFHIQLFPIARRVKIDAPVTDGVKNG